MLKSPPSPLLYRPFGDFLDRLSDYPQDEDNVDLDALESAAVERFASAMCKHYMSENGRQNEALSLLNEIFSSCERPLLN